MPNCVRVLIRGAEYAICEATPFGFTLCRIDEPEPLQAYPGHLGGWFAAVNDFHALGDTIERPALEWPRTA